jgi:hypothetical protein
MNDDSRPPLPRLFHVYMGILVILGAFAFGINVRYKSCHSVCVYAGSVTVCNDPWQGYVRQE